MTVHTLELPTGSKVIEMRGTGPTVLVVHGGPGMDYSYMESGLAGLEDRWTLAYYEQAPLQGEALATATAKSQVDELAAIATSLSLQMGSPLRILAHSWGTYLAIELFREEAPPISHVTLINPVPLTWERFLKAGERLIERVESHHLADVERLEAEGTEAAGRALMKLVTYAYLARDSHDDIAIRFDRYSPQVNAKIVATVEGYNQISLVPSLRRTPTSLIYGDQDYLIPEDTSELHDFARSVTLKSCGHFPFAEQPVALRNALVEALG